MKYQEDIRAKLEKFIDEQGKHLETLKLKYEKQLEAVEALKLSAKLVNKILAVTNTKVTSKPYVTELPSPACNISQLDLPSISYLSKLSQDNLHYSSNLHQSSFSRKEDSIVDEKTNKVRSIKSESVNEMKLQNIDLNDSDAKEEIINHLPYSNVVLPSIDEILTYQVTESYTELSAEQSNNSFTSQLNELTENTEQDFINSKESVSIDNYTDAEKFDKLKDQADTIKESQDISVHDELANPISGIEDAHESSNETVVIHNNEINQLQEFTIINTQHKLELNIRDEQVDVNQAIMDQYYVSSQLAGTEEAADEVVDKVNTESRYEVRLHHKRKELTLDVFKDLEKAEEFLEDFKAKHRLNSRCSYQIIKV
jgi:hypothetical protein